MITGGRSPKVIVGAGSKTKAPAPPGALHQMKRILTTATLLLLAPAALYAQAPTTLLQNFRNPPPESRPMVRWWWFGPAVEKPEILRELQQMKADGIGGAELAFVYPEQLENNLPFLSPEMLSAVTYAQAEGRKLGLRIDVTLCSGWPYGGPATTLAEAAGRLRTIEVAVPATSTSVPYPRLAEGESLLSASLATGDPKHWDAASATLIPGPIATTKPQPTIPFPAAPTPRTALFFIASHTRQQVKRAAAGAEGFVLDPFSHEAVATHLRAVGEPLVKAFGTTPPYAIFSDSLEAYGADWTPKLPEEFLKRRGYDLIPHLPELVAGGTPAADTIRHDYGRTLTELVNENYLVQINDWAKAHHTKFRSQTYGEPAVSFSSQRLVSLPEGEGPQWRQFSTLRWATSANHVFGNNVTSGETFTWLHSPVFRATPLDMKAEADVDFLTGENQLIFHGWPYSPSAEKLTPGDPGWSLYAAAVFNDHNPWHPVMPAVTQYIARISYLLRQGQPANQVAILLPTDDAWASFSPGKVTVTGAMAKLITPALMSTILSAGYNADFIDADAINSVGLGTHQIVVIPPTDRIPVDTLRKLNAFIKTGGKVLALGHLPTQDPEGKPTAEIPTLTKAIPLIPGTDQLTQALHNAVHPDLSLTSDADQIGFIRRHLPNADIYFVANTGNRIIDTTATFATTHKSAQQWNPESGVTSPAAASSQPIHLAPYESRTFVFSDGVPKPGAPGLASETWVSKSHKNPTPLADLSTDWKVTFTTLNKTTTQPTLKDWLSDPTTKNYSGEAVYTRDFTLTTAPKSATYLQVDGGTAIPMPTPPPVRPTPDPRDPTQRPANAPLPNPLVTGTGPGMHAYFDPPLHEAALVIINGHPAGALWHPPYRLDVTKLLKSGQNHIEIRVYNTALNAWSAIPPRDYGPLKAKYGDRFQMQDLDRVKPIPSGILGPIHLIQESTQEPTQ
jgi:hypothetical protein